MLLAYYDLKMNGINDVTDNISQIIAESFYTILNTTVSPL